MFTLLAIAWLLQDPAAVGGHVSVFRPDLSIVSETVAVDLAAGANTLRLDFTRGNADLTTLQAFPLDRGGAVRIAAITRRDELPNALFLEVLADSAGRERFELRYAARGYSAAPTYSAVYDAVARTLEFSQELEIGNDSGEPIVGARVDALFGDVRVVGSQPVTHGRAADPQGGPAAGLPPEPLVKDAAEHTVVEFGADVDVANGSALRKRVFAISDVPVAIEYRFRADEAGGRVTRRIKAQNAAGSGLGGRTLQPGRCVVTEKDASGSERFAAAVDLGSLAPGGELELGLAIADDLFVERDRVDHSRLDLTFGEYNRALVSFSEVESFRLEIRNHSSEERRLVVHEVVSGTDTFDVVESSVSSSRKDRNLLEFQVVVPAASKTTLTYTVKKTNLRAG